MRECAVHMSCRGRLCASNEQNNSEQILPGAAETDVSRFTPSCHSAAQIRSLLEIAERNLVEFAKFIWKWNQRWS
jgi:hypothetical protein